MKVMIAIPCMDYLEADFIECLTNMILYHKADVEIDVRYLKASLVYDAWNQLVKHATKTGGFDYILWLDSDMTFDSDLLDRLLADMDGRDMVSGLCFGRRPPFKPCVYKDLQVKQEGQVIMPSVDPYYDYPRDQIFEVAACGFACVMMRMDVLKTMGIYGGVPFFPVAGLGEDLAFCWRAAKMGITFHCDSRLKIGHIMRLSVDEGFRDKLLEGQQI